ncbi:peptidase domain-containing ABC transporter [Burkholderia pseudomultivorans]|uniref:peptidase domain-containing ABC transporter n=1 Tax=Burkholderia pseudomultivorans TaxID=1207504 RepID=UPI00075259EF|nr:peptidase domain-containing ABC transporter [Burkholderia pseudomultivorans]KWF03159.1 hypothetical protein WT55_26315 [Burkholderia pseudomultivorans]
MSLLEIFGNLQVGLRKKVPVVLQNEAAECGLACVCMVASFHGYGIDLRQLRQRFSISLKGTTLANLVEIGSHLKLTARPLSLELDEVHHLKLPCILHWSFNHFVVLERVRSSSVEIVDPAHGRSTVEWNELSRNFTGVALELMPNPDFKRAKRKEKLRVRELTGRIIGLKRSLSQVFLLAIAIEICTIVTPFFVQWVTDEAIVTGDEQLVLTLAIGFGIVWTSQTAIEALRAWIVAHMGASLNVQWLANVGNRLFHLPGSFFGKRHLGDIVTRVNTINVIQNTISTSVVEAVLDGAMSIGTLMMMIIYDAKLALISVCALAIYIALRISLYGALRSANESQFVFDAKQHTYLLESVRGIQSIKLFGKEQSRVAGWLNHVVRQKNAWLRTQRLLVLFHGANSFIFRAESLIVVVMGASAVIEKAFSIGMLLAYLSYREQFSKRVTSLVDKVYEFRMLDVQLNRLADIMYEKEEMRTTGVETTHSPAARIVLNDVSFRYADDDAEVVKNFSMAVDPGEHVAIVGASGSGKTTILKIIAGLLRPTSGTVHINDSPIEALGTMTHRRLIGTVMQEDLLFAGTLAENICFFDEMPDHARIRESARIAAIEDDINRMPMGFNSMVGDMGSVLSGGQKQRVLLARALYRQPSVLLLDEATSHLDVENEKRVNDAIKRLSLTRIVVAHRPETIASADRIIDVSTV